MADDRPASATYDGTIVEDLKQLVEPVTMGDPMRPLIWVSKSQEKLADELGALGHDVSPNTVGRLLVDELAYSRQVNRKTHEGLKRAIRAHQRAGEGGAGSRAATTTKTGLKLECVLDKAHLREVHQGQRRLDGCPDIRGDTFHPEWNYAVHPRPAK
jgi:hypothetical protein